MRNFRNLPRGPSFNTGSALRIALQLHYKLRNPQICINRYVGSDHQSGHQRDDYHLHTRVCKSHFAVFGWFACFAPKTSYMLIPVIAHQGIMQLHTCILIYYPCYKLIIYKFLKYFHIQMNKIK